MSKSPIYTAQAPAPIGPYSQAIRVKDTLYVSGQIALHPQSGELVNGSVEEETKQVMQNLEAILKAAGMSFSNIAKCTIFIKNMDDFGTINKIYGSFFTDEQPPARETVEVSRLPKDVRVEISCIAVA